MKIQVHIICGAVAVCADSKCASILTFLVYFPVGFGASSNTFDYKRVLWSWSPCGCRNIVNRYVRIFGKLGMLVDVCLYQQGHIDAFLNVDFNWISTEVSVRFTLLNTLFNIRFEPNLGL